jgi:hypothetical protein
MKTREIKIKPLIRKKTIVRLIPDDYNKILLYTQVPFEEHEIYRIFEPKIEYIALERNYNFKYYGIKTLKGIAANLMYLNDWMDKELLLKYVKFIVINHFSEEFSDDIICNIVNWVYKLNEDGKLRANGKLRRLIFKPGNSLTKEQKREIIGKFSGKFRTVDAQSVYDYIEGLQDSLEPITFAIISKKLECSVSTVKNVIPNEVKGYLSDINNTIRLNRDIERYQVALDSLLQTGNSITDLAIKKLLNLSGTRFNEVKLAVKSRTEKDK